MAPDRIRIRVLTTDDHPVVRAGIKAMLAHELDIDVIIKKLDAKDRAHAVTIALQRGFLS